MITLDPFLAYQQFKIKPSMNGLNKITVKKQCHLKAYLLITLNFIICPTSFQSPF